MSREEAAHDKSIQASGLGVSLGSETGSNVSGVRLSKKNFLSKQVGVKVPEVTAMFWIAKILTTAAGESASDYMVHALDPYIAVAIGAVAFSGALLVQLSLDRFVPWAYWSGVVMVGIFGTMVADAIHIQLKIPYAVSSGAFAVTLAVVFIAWHKSEGTLSIHSIHNRRRELFYWASVISTFALGTATGDLTAATLGLGYLVSGIFFVGAIAIPAAGYWKGGLNPVLAFWAAYVITRPLGASFADWFGKPKSLGALGMGDAPVSGVLLAGIVVCVIAMTIGQRPESKHGRQQAQAS